MRESKFIEQNQENWRELESLLDKPSDQPEQMYDMFIKITDDLSYSRTYYPNRSIKKYLNSLAQRLYLKISKKSQRKSTFRELWTKEIPYLFYEARKELLVSFLVFVLAMAIGVLSSAMDTGFARTILGSSYIAMTEENIAAGDPMAVYKDDDTLPMWLNITANNLSVSLFAYLFGIFFGLGTLGVLLQNGVMVGTFQYMFYTHDLLQESFLTIWMHGAFEISAIILSGACGLVLGGGLAFPGSYTRLKSFEMSAKRSIKMILGIVPLFLIAGFIEAYITRITEVPDGIRLFFILSCFGGVLYYYVFLPSQLARSGYKTNSSPDLAPDRQTTIDITQNKSISKIFYESLLIYFTNYSFLFPVILLSALICGILTTYTLELEGNNEWAQSLIDILIALGPIRAIAIALVVTPVIWTVLIVIKNVYRLNSPEFRLSNTKTVIETLLFSAGFALLAYINARYNFYVLVFLAPILVAFFYELIFKKDSPNSSVSGIYLSVSYLSKSLLLFLYYYAIGYGLLYLYNGFMVRYALDSFWLMFNDNSDLYITIRSILTYMLPSFLLLSIVPLFIIGGSLAANASHEYYTGQHLRKALMSIGQNQRTKGIERE